MKKRKPRVWLRCVLAAMSMGILFVGAWMVLDQPSRLFGDSAAQDEDALNVVGVRSYDWLRIMGAAGDGNATYQTLSNEEALIDWVAQGSDVVLGSHRVVAALKEHGRVSAEHADAPVEVVSSPWVLVYRGAVPEERTWAAWWESTRIESLGIPDDPALLLTLARRARVGAPVEKSFDVGLGALEERVEPRSESDLVVASLHRLALRIRRVDSPDGLVKRMRAGELDAVLLPVHWTAGLDDGWAVWRPEDGFPVRHYYGVVLEGSSRGADAVAWVQDQAERFEALQMPAIEKTLKGPFFVVDPLLEEERRMIRRIVRGMEKTGKHIDRSMDNNLLVDP